MNKRVSILSLIGFLIALGVMFGWFNNGMNFGFPSFFAFFILFGFLGNVFRSKPDQNPNSNKNYEQNETNIRSESIFSTKKAKDIIECEYCGHHNDKSREYCENCGARILPN